MRRLYGGRAGPHSGSRELVAVTSRPGCTAAWHSRRVTDRDALLRLADEPFVDLVSFRPDGSAAHTPVWVSGDGERLFVSTFRHSWKVARIRGNPVVAVAACDGPGHLLPGAVYVPGRAELLDRSEFRPGVRAHRVKYGRHFGIMWPARWPLRLIGKRRVWLLVSPAPDVALPPIDPPAVVA
jgi:PPOX class probable F420-dependent enzyme